MEDDDMPAADRSIDVGGARIHYRDEGTGPTLLMVHGNPTSSYLYRHLLARLRDRFRCIAPDLPGFGRSMAPPGFGFTAREHSTVLESFVERLALRETILFVHDWGGPIGLGVAGRRPELVRALVVANTWAWPVNGDLHFEYFSRLMGGALGRALIRRWNVFVNVVVPLCVRRRRLTAEEMAAYRAPFSTPDSRLPTAIFPAQILDARPYLAEVESGLGALRDRPVLIVWGTKDIAFRPRERERFERLFPRHRTVLLDGAGHLVQEDAPDEIAAALRAGWLAEAVAGELP